MKNNVKKIKCQNKNAVNYIKKYKEYKKNNLAQRIIKKIGQKCKMNILIKQFN